jgi:aminopeptidase N
MQGPGSAGRSTPHEVSHMWFYGLVGNDQGRDPWLDEGLASYAEFRILGNLDASSARSIPAGGKGRAGEPMTYWETRQGIYYRSVYVQGAVAVASLGPVDLVDCALHLYVERNAYRIATPADLRAALEVVLPGATAGLAPYGLAG